MDFGRDPVTGPPFVEIRVLDGLPGVLHAGNWLEIFRSDRMDKDVKLPLIHFKPLSEWKPKIGDIIIRHGWIVRTKWFGVINLMRPDGTLQVVRDGMIKLLVMTPPGLMLSKAVDMSVGEIQGAVPGTYAVLQQDKVGVWYV